MNTSIPETMRRYVEGRMERGGSGNASEYICHLIREDQMNEAREQLELALLEGPNSGPPEPVDEAFWEKRRAKLAKRTRRTKKAG